jgi:hypothetical protein
MRHSTIACLALAALTATACGTPEPTYSSQPTVTPSPPVPVDALYLWRHWSALVGDTVPVRGYVRRGGEEGPDTLSWIVQSPDIASIEVVDKDRIRVHALRTGRTLVTASTTGSRTPLGATMELNVLAPSAEPSPIVADEFRIDELSPSPFYAKWSYVPQLTLRGTPNQGSSRIVALTVELPGFGTVWQCSTDRVLGPTPWSVFAPAGSMDGLYFPSDRAIDAGTLAVARVTVRLEDTLGVRLTVKGAITPGARQPGWPEGGDIASCE